MLEGRGGVALRMASSRAARRVGIYSYAIYVLHNPLGYVLHRDGIVPRPLAGTSVLATITYAAGMTAVTVLIAAGSWHLFEKPLLRLRRRYRLPTSPA
jgi:peptidoglycan/LPS O-acetylase OafA/YrhL